MKKTEFKARLFELWDIKIDDVSYEDKMKLIERYFIEFQIKHDEQRDRPNKGDSWTDEELRVVLMDAPTKSNCIKYAKIFGRGYGSIEQIYRWASTDDRTVKEKRPDDAFVAHVKQIAKELGWRA
ncbi:hypothetical protein KFE19_16155 [Dysosmobacter sp. Marseille-Q4140]|nr:hypothetical protein KFE19_16155 [Dysosmobacter sp. Marseille-Q4140]